MLHQRAETVAVPLRGMEASRTFFTPCLTGSGADLLWVAHVDSGLRCIHLSGHPLSAGRSAAAAEILRDVAAVGSAGLVLAEAANADRPAAKQARDTQALAQAAEAMDCSLLDHLLFADEDCTSMRRQGLI